MHMKVDMVESMFKHCVPDMHLMRIALHMGEYQLPGRRLLGLLFDGCRLAA